MQIDWFEGLEGLQRLRADWTGLHDSCDLYARHEWQLALARHLDGAAACAWLRLADGAGRVQAIVPAIDGQVALPLLGHPRATTLGLHPHLALFDFPLAPQADAGAVGAALLRALRERKGGWSVLSWPRIMAGGNAARVARALRAPAARIWPAHPCNTFDTARPYAALQEGLSKKFRSNLRWCRRRLADAGALQVRHAREAGTLAADFEAFLRIEASGWKGSAGSAIALAPGARAFYEELLAQHGPGFESDIALLCCGEEVVAAEFVLRAARWLHVYKIGYAESQARFSPGHLLFESVLERACADPGTDRVSLVTDEAWQAVWQPLVEPTLQAVALRPAWRDAAFSGYLLARRARDALRARAAAAAARPAPQE